jgi:crotonobetainyl-CoA:carnitine CoA-transferase CaiB-like acyl-CoA transferase
VTPELPLAGLRVVDMADVKGELCGRYLADLGADVIRVEPPEGAASRRLPPFHDDTSLYFAVRNANKRGVAIDLASADGRERLLRLLETADVWIESTAPGTLAPLGLGPDDALARNPSLVITSVADFGQTGPYRDWLATDWVHVAMSGILGRSGLPGQPPLMPPGGMAYETAAIQAAWATLVAYRHRLRTGRGDHVDVSVYEAAGQIMDPTFGSASVSRPANWSPPHGRVASGLYPIFPCADGFVRLVVLAPRQWRNMRAWLGEPQDLQDAALDSVPGRQAAEERLNPVYAEFFRDRRKVEVSEEGQARGIAVTPVLTIADVLENAHYAARGALLDAEVAPGVAGRLPSGFVEIDGRRIGFRHRAPETGEHDDLLDAPPPARPRPAAAVANGDGPLAGLRVVDFGIIVIGNEVGRLFADLGAEVIKIENRAFPDAARVAIGGEMSAAFAAGSRNKKSFGVDLRTPEGNAILKRLVAVSDVVCENFKPGTLDGLGLGYDALCEVKPNIVLLSSNAVGSTGPWSNWLGYGPIVRSVSGITSLWRYPENESSHSDATTIYPDHYAARVVATAVLAALLRRDRTGAGAHVTCSQAEATLNHLSDLFLAASLGDAAAGRPAGNRSDMGAPWGVYPCLGDDEWCTITVRDDDEWARLRGALGDPDWASAPELAASAGRIARRGTVDARLAEWTETLPPRELMERLQAAGVPAGMMMRPSDQEVDPHLVAREFWREVEQPAVGSIPMENSPFRSRMIPSVRIAPAAFHGEHTRELCASLLDMDEAEIDGLFESGVLEEPLPEHRPAAGAAR